MSVALTAQHPEVHAALAAAGLGDLFDERQHRSCELLERYALEHAVDLCGRLGLAEALAASATAEELRAARGFVPAFVPVLDWILERLAEADLLARQGRGYRLARPLPPPALEEVRALGLATDARYAPGYRLFDEAAAVCPPLARGEASGEQALLRKLGLWIAYFSNDNPHYALNNQLAARAAADRLPPAAHVLEVGAGLGSATTALAAVLRGRDASARVARYRFTEPALLFRRRAERTLDAAELPAHLEFASLDVNLPWQAQGVPPGSQHLVWGVNVFHLAHDVDAVLAEAAAALAPGGWLVVGEGMRPWPARVVGAEFPFRMLERFTAVRLDPATRPLPGFLSAAQWTAALRRAGLCEIALVPDVERLQRLQPVFMAAAACGRRPA